MSEALNTCSLNSIGNINTFVNTCSLNSIGDINTFVGILIQTILASQCLISQPNIWPPDYAEEALKNGLQAFDFVIVGAGSAGSVVASELTENPNWKVLVLEEGDDPPQESEVPSLFFNIQNTKYAKNTLIQSNGISCKASPNGQCVSGRGKVLGGGGSVNGMLYVRGNRVDYDNWLAEGNKGWGYDDVWPYFEQLVRAVGNETHPKGYLNVNEFPLFDEDIFEIIYNTAKEVGQNHVDDFVDPNYTGYAKVKGTLQNGHRSSTAKSFLTKVSQRTNLKVIKNAKVTKLNFDPEQKRVISIDFLLQDKHSLSVNVIKEAIISAGALGTPQLLMLSGVGPKEVLKPLNIPLVKNLPIGQNLQDHVIVGYFVAIEGQDIDETNKLDAIYQYILYSQGPLSSHGATSLMGFINTDPSSNQKYPDIGIYHAALRKGDNFALNTFMNAFPMNDNVKAYLKDIMQHHDILAMLTMPSYPKSRGNITLYSSLHTDDPIINANYLQEKEDRDILLRGAKYLRRLVNTKAFQAKNAFIIPIPLEECDIYDRLTDDYWRCYISYCTMSGFHYSGTVKMGPMNNPSSCVNPRLKVKGFDNLRVVDASIMPLIPSANTNGPTMMIAKKASDIIKKDWNFI